MLGSSFLRFIGRSPVLLRVDFAFVSCPLCAVCSAPPANRPESGNLSAGALIVGSGPFGRESPGCCAAAIATRLHSAAKTAAYLAVWAQQVRAIACRVFIVGGASS